MEISSSTSVSILPIMSCKKTGHNYLRIHDTTRASSPAAAALNVQPAAKAEVAAVKKNTYIYFYKCICKYIIYNKNI